MKFDINNYKGNYVMHCKTKKEARDFCNYLHSVGKTWNGGAAYLDNTHYEDGIVYYFNEGTFGSLFFAETASHHTILEWSDFMNNDFTKADLKTGDIVLRRNGKVEIVILDFAMFLCKDGYNLLSNVNDDLTSKIDADRDIVAVRRPFSCDNCVFSAFEYDYGTLIYERKEVEEMTLEEVCKALGKEIKIIKG